MLAEKLVLDALLELVLCLHHVVFQLAVYFVINHSLFPYLVYLVSQLFVLRQIVIKLDAVLIKSLLQVLDFPKQFFLVIEHFDAVWHNIGPIVSIIFKCLLSILL